MGERLGREVAILAGRLAGVLERLPAEGSGPVGDGRSFLLSLFESFAGGRPLDAWAGGPLDRPPSGPPHPIDRLAAALSLSPFEVDLLLLAGMPEEHEGLAGILRLLHPRGDPRPTVGLAAQLLCHGFVERLLLREVLSTGSAVGGGAVRLDPEGPFSERSLVLAEELWPALHGLDAWPSPMVRRTDPVATAGLRAWFESAPASLAIRALARREPCTAFVTADSEAVALQRAGALAQHAGVEAVRCAPSAVTPEVERLIAVHALARGVVPIVMLPTPDGPGPSDAPSFAGFPAPVVLCARAGSVVVRGRRPLFAVPVDRLAPPDRRVMWSETLPELSQFAPYLAARHAVEPALAADTAADVRTMQSLGGRVAGVEDVALSVRSRAGLSVSGGVKLLRPTVGWDRLVLTPDRLEQLHEAVSRLRHQSRVLDDWGFLHGRPGARGVRMLFSGPPGTGKTLSAEVLAFGLSVDLLVVDISRVVSKWIGETEKNLAEVFDTAERAEAVLFFDEADALFGRRTEVSDAHDRYANLETAYLLARLERFEGLAILSTNLRQNIDPAFIRRLEFVVDFDEPGRSEREALWRCHLPPNAPLAPDVDLSELAALYPIVGAMIRNAAVAAGFLAASDGGFITRTHFVRAIRREYEKAGRAFPGSPVPMAAP